MVTNANTIVNPRTVVIVALYADVAYGAVTGTWGSNNFTIRAKICRTEFLKKLQKW